MSYIAKLRQKPKHVRDNIAFVAAGVATLPVVAYLVFAVHGPAVTGGITETEATDTKFFETFTSQVKEQVASVRSASTSTTPETKKYPNSVDRGPLDAVPVVPVGSTGQSVLIATTSATTSTTSLEIDR